MRTFTASFRVQLLLMRRSPGDLAVLVTAPFFSLMFLSMTQQAARSALTPYAVAAPVLIAVWTMSLFVAGDLISSERSGGRLEALVATPAPLSVVIMGRICAAVALSMLAFVETWLVGWLCFGIVVPVPHPAVLVAALAATVLAMAGTATMMAAVFVLARSARIFQNTLSYPVYLLAGVLVPVSLLPGWLQPFSRAVFLYWGAGLLRDSLAPPDVPQLAGRLAMVLVLGATGFVAGQLLMRQVLRRVRVLGTLGQA
ncbi:MULTISPECIES: ABC transporter permease [unclassified Kitasatospora]|uniref:ABC transporter permease n=1 Tax=unclassified Kitasatospora TaxID=2633591 RepID=UPI001AE00D5B|nr:ABC transporter permease [Kitasatospora sp. RG8]MBP0451124.1 ABC transporter permease [Kitasatospora sp. RG8]